MSWLFNKTLRRCCLVAAWGGVLAGSMGASCSPRTGTPFGFGGPQAPVVLTPTSTAADIVAAVNANTARVQTYQASQATLSMPGTLGLPLLSSSIALERPDRIRLRATTAITGPEVDIGSNEERFWVWARRNEPAGVYTATHDAFRSSAAQRQLPIDPAWLVDALGLPTLDPAAAYDGPVPRGDGTVELRANVTTPTGVAARVYRIDDRTAEVREQHLYDATGSLVVSVTLKQHRYDPVANVSLPREVELNVPAAQLALRIDTGPVVVNAPIADGGQLWRMPQLNGYPVVDLAAPVPIAAGGWSMGGAGLQQPPVIAKQYGVRPPSGAVAPTPIASSVSSSAVVGAPRAAYGHLPAGGVAIER